MRKKVFYNKGCEAPAQVAQRGGECPVRRHIQGWEGGRSKQPEQAVDISVHFRGVGLDSR